MARSLLRLFKVFVVLFPLGIGLFLTYTGAARLNQANEIPAPKLPSPYGIVAFGSERFVKCELSLYMDEINLAQNWIKAKIISTLSVSRVPNSSRELTFGVQIPHDATPVDYTVTAITGPSNDRIDVETIDEKKMSVADSRTSIIYVKFVTSALHAQYEVLFQLEWRDLVTKQGFSTYDVIVPFSIAPISIVDRHIANVSLVESTVCTLGLSLPTGSELREAFPLPSEQTAEGFPDPKNPRLVHYLKWWWKTELSPGPTNPTSHVIRVRLEVRSEEELRSQLLFDSGLYMGLGLGLILGSVHESLKLALEWRERNIGQVQTLDQYDRRKHTLASK